MKVEVKILSGDKSDLEKSLSDFLNKGFEINGGLIHEEGNYFYVLLIKNNNKQH